MAKKGLDLVVGAVIAKLSDKYSITNIRSQAKLKSLGVKTNQLANLKKELYSTVSDSDAPDYHEFLKNFIIRPSSTVAQVAKALSKAYGAPLDVKVSQGAAQQRQAHVRAAVHTVIARAAPKYSITVIRPEKTLADYGIRSKSIAGIKIDLSKTLSGSSNAPVKVAWPTGHITPSSTVKDLVNATCDAVIIQIGTGRTKKTDKGRSRIKERKGGFSPIGEQVMDSLGGDETRHGKGGF